MIGIMRQPCNKLLIPVIREEDGHLENNFHAALRRINFLWPIASFDDDDVMARGESCLEDQSKIFSSVLAT